MGKDEDERDSVIIASINGVCKCRVKVVEPICPYHKSSKSPICALGVPGGGELCAYHKASPKSTDSRNLNFIEEPTYNSLDEAAMAAANIIFHHVSAIYSKIEYGIAIYKNNATDKFCLVETRMGDDAEVKSQNDYNIGDGCCYTFKADVHSHPISYDEKNPTFDNQRFSVGDYILSCGSRNHGSKPILLDRFENSPGPHIKYLVRIPQREKNIIAGLVGPKEIIKNRPSFTTRIKFGERLKIVTFMTNRENQEHCCGNKNT